MDIHDVDVINTFKTFTFRHLLFQTWNVALIKSRCSTYSSESSYCYTMYLYSMPKYGCKTWCSEYYSESSYCYTMYLC